jgi:hypothetical protein
MVDSVLEVQNIKLPDSGGVTSSTAITLDASGNVTLAGTANDLGTVSAGTIGGGVTMASSGLTVRNIVQVPLVTDQYLYNSTTDTTFFSPTYTPLFSGSKVQGLLMFYGAADHQTTDIRKILTLNFTGLGITNLSTNNDVNVGGYSYDGNGMYFSLQFLTGGQLLTTTSTDIITCNCKLQNYVANVNSGWRVRGNNTIGETHFTWIEYK